MKTIVTKVYTLDELSPAAKEKAREWYRDASADDTFGAECIIEDAKRVGVFLGLEISRIYYSGFWSQGDGACFEGSWHPANVTEKDLLAYAPKDDELARLAKAFAELAAEFPDARFSVRHSGRYYHEYCTRFSIECDGDEFEERAAEASRDFMRWIYRQLENDWDYRNSDEQIDETIRANEYTFTEVGTRFG